MKGYKAFVEGKSVDCYKIFGCHKVEEYSYRFTVWAPNAQKVAVVGDFNAWNTTANQLEKVQNGVFSSIISAVQPNQCYKYFITTNDGRTLYKADPYAFFSQVRPETASVVWSGEKFEWTDNEYLSKKKLPYDQPMNIYEVHAGSWRRHYDGRYYSYRDLAEHLVPYVKEMGYTHVEFMPLSEYPFDGSWGYQVTGYYSPTSRYGTPDDLRYLVNQFHKAGIGVILDWVPAHFCKDAHGLMEFDGGWCYESWDEKRREHASWGTRIFDYGRPEVRSFLISNALYWLKEFHVDGLRVDAVASMLYLDYDKGDGQWVPNIYGGKENLEAIEFMHELSCAVFKYSSKALLLAEESTAFNGVTHPVYNGGLGFNFKWNMGWMNDTLYYMSVDPMWKADHHNKLTFLLTYAYSENFILPFSHDEVVHLKGSMINKMSGNYDEKFALYRALLGLQFAQPGKKLNFMGNELAQFNEWNENVSLDWMLLDYFKHSSFKDYVKHLNHLYAKTSALYENDSNWAGFRWVLVDGAQDNVVCCERFNSNGDSVLAVVNFSKNDYKDYGFQGVGNAKYELVLNSDEQQFGGEGKHVYPMITSNDGVVSFDVPKQTTLYYKSSK